MLSMLMCALRELVPYFGKEWAVGLVRELMQQILTLGGE